MTSADQDNYQPIIGIAGKRPDVAMLQKLYREAECTHVRDRSGRVFRTSRLNAKSVSIFTENYPNIGRLEYNRVDSFGIVKEATANAA